MKTPTTHHPNCLECDQRREPDSDYCWDHRRLASLRKAQADMKCLAGVADPPSQGQAPSEGTNAREEI